MPFDGSAYVRHIAERLISEFTLSERAGTPGLIGAAKEHPARTQFERLMPGGVRVGSGIVVDSYGSASRQQDIVVYEELCPIFTHNDAPEATYYPIEGVIAVGEVKSGLGKKELIDAMAKCASVKKLIRHAIATDDGVGSAAISFRKYGNGTCFACTPAEQYDQWSKSLDQVYSFILCQRFEKDGLKMLADFAAECRTVGPYLAPNMLTSLNDGSIYPFSSSSGSILRSMMDGDGAILSRDAVGGFAQLVSMLRLYVVSGRTVDRQHFERYFRAPGAVAAKFTIDGRIAF